MISDREDYSFAAVLSRRGNRALIRHDQAPTYANMVAPLGILGVLRRMWPGQQNDAEMKRAGAQRMQRKECLWSSSFPIRNPCSRCPGDSLHVGAVVLAIRTLRLAGQKTPHSRLEKRRRRPYTAAVAAPPLLPSF